MEAFTLHPELAEWPMKHFHYNQPFTLENGQQLPALTIAYHTYGKLNERKDNVVWVCHALTASADAADWWKGVVGEGCVIDPARYFIVCANILGSCYGTTGPLSEDPATAKPWYHRFPMVTIRDMVKAHILLRNHLGIRNIYLLMGGSMGGYQALEWSLMEPDQIKRLFLLATSPTESAWWWRSRSGTPTASSSARGPATSIKRTTQLRSRTTTGFCRSMPTSA